MRVASAPVSHVYVRHHAHPSGLDAVRRLPDRGVFDFTEESFDPESLRRAMRAACDRWDAGAAAPRATWAGCRAERVRIARTRRALYERAFS
jgi:hypothetical protein